MQVQVFTTDCKAEQKVFRSIEQTLDKEKKPQEKEAACIDGTKESSENGELTPSTPDADVDMEIIVKKSSVLNIQSLETCPHKTSACKVNRDLPAQNVCSFAPELMTPEDRNRHEELAASLQETLLLKTDEWQSTLETQGIILSKTLGKPEAVVEILKIEVPDSIDDLVLIKGIKAEPDEVKPVPAAEDTA